MEVCTWCDIAYIDKRGCPNCIADRIIKELEEQIKQLQRELDAQKS